MLRTIANILLISGLVMTSLTSLVNAKPAWKWGHKHYWKVDFVGYALLLVGVPCYLFI